MAQPPLVHRTVDADEDDYNNIFALCVRREWINESTMLMVGFESHKNAFGSIKGISAPIEAPSQWRRRRTARRRRQPIVHSAHTQEHSEMRWLCVGREWWKSKMWNTPSAIHFVHRVTVDALCARTHISHITLKYRRRNAFARINMKCTAMRHTIKNC